MRVLMVVRADYKFDARARREAEALADAGHQIIVFSLGDPRMSNENITHVSVGRAGSGVASARRRTWWFRLLRWMFLPEHRARAQRRFTRAVVGAAADLPEPIDAVHAHDLSGLIPGARVARRLDAVLVYDSHEYWSGMPRYGRPSPIRAWRDRRVERRLALSADSVITVSAGCADRLAQDFGRRDVAVVRNTFPRASRLRPVGGPVGAVYAGRIGSGRDLSTVFSAASWSEGRLGLHVMGNLEPGFEVPPVAHIHPAGTIADVDELLIAQGVALVPLAEGPINHDVALPNKLFQAIAVGVPVVAADLPEMARVVTETGVGVVYAPGSRSSLEEAVHRLLSSYDEFALAARRASETITWEVDAGTLVSIYASLSASITIDRGRVVDLD